MTEGQRKVLIRQMCEDLAGKTEPQIADACKRWRKGTKSYFPTSGQLLELMKNPYEDPPARHREIFGDGCRCPRCTSKEHREGFYVAPPVDYRRDAKAKEEIDYWFEQQIPASRLDEAEMHTRFLMTQELVRDHGWEWETAKGEIATARTRILYPEFRVWPKRGTE